jgi:glutamyl-tRNA synthetase
MTRVRFAPSPTGYLHVGGLRTALYNYLLARKTKGTFLLRIEDTDQNRLVPDATENILDALSWAGVSPDEGAGKGGPHGPYIQSERLEIYRNHAAELVEKGHAYPCFCTPAELAARREEQTRQGLSSMYDRRCRALSRDEARHRIEAGETHVIRMKIPDERSLVVDDLVRGPVEFSSAVVDDQVLVKSDGFPTYHLAAVVDDHLMEITHVIRGEEWLTSTPKHLLLYEYFGWEPPRFAHLPLIFNRQKKKLSKRDGDVAVEAYREKGYFPEALVNFLALIGWSPGDDREFFTLPELVEAFSIERVNKSSGVFDLDKLNYIQRHYVKTLPTETLVERALPCFESPPERAYLGKIIDLMRERVTFMQEVPALGYFYQDPEQYDEKVLKKRWKESSAELMTTFAQRLEALSSWTVESTEGCLRALAEERELNPAELIHPTRLAISGVGAGAGLFETMEVLGRPACVRRLRAAADRIQLPVA